MGHLDDSESVEDGIDRRRASAEVYFVSRTVAQLARVESEIVEVIRPRWRERARQPVLGAIGYWSLPSLAYAAETAIPRATMKPAMFLTS